MRSLAAGLCLFILTAACRAPETGVLVAHLGAEGRDASGFAAVRRAFEARNPGYRLEFHEAARTIVASAAPRVLFVQSEPGAGRLLRDGSSEPIPVLTVGDVVLLRPGEELHLDPPVDLVVFTVPEPLPGELPGVVRPDWDERITDTPGGCATETGAYRRILLTWLGENGPYVYRALNAHRVRITDSFTHYHPVEGGFDELYLVQMAGPEARLLTSEAVARIEAPRTVARDEAASLFRTHSLAVGDLVYLPRGTVHRGLGGVLAQVITTPGFVPGAEIGVDEHLREINARLGLEGAEALPVHGDGAGAR